MEFLEETIVFGVKVKWQKCINCGQQVFTSSPPEQALCGNCDRDDIEPKRYKKNKIPDKIRWAVWERDNFICQKCGSRKDLTIDHVYPESKGGKMTMKNAQTLCRTCNSSKGAR